jgi:crotonobetainyl-CoA:carnitine CoA-transferase CaiB-like acyl-CoA transferase
MTGILLALQARHRTGRGQRIEATLFDTGLSLLFPQAPNWFCSGQEPKLLGSAHPNIAPYDKFSARDGDVFIGILNDSQFRRFCGRIGRAELAEDERYRSTAHRLENRDSLKIEIEFTLANFRTKDLCEDLMENGVPAGRVNTVPEAFSHPHVAHRQMLVGEGDARGIGIPIKLSETPGSPGTASPRFGQHTEEILAEIGFSTADIDGLRASGALITKQEKN